MKLWFSVASLIVAALAYGPAASSDPEGNAALAVATDATSQEFNFVSAFEAWRARTRNEGFNAVEESLLSRAAQGSDPQATSDIAYFYVAMGLYPEAGGVIRSINETERGADLMILEGVAALKLRRWRDAASILSRPPLKTLPQAAPWRGIAYTELGAFHDAAFDLLQTEHTATPFEEHAAQFYLAKAQAALAIGHLDPARRALNSIGDHIETRDQRDWRRLLEARLQLARGGEGAALNSLTTLQRDGAAPVSLHAEIDLIRHRQSTSALTLADALDQLRAIGLRWSGGGLERERLELEAALEAQSGNRLAAVAAHRKIVLRFPASDAARSSEKHIRTALSTIMTDETVSPRDAAKTFYENIDLAPPGAEGDALIRDAVNTLAGLDLLPEAAELLRHQVFNRLRGAKRSEIAADLAALYLGAGDPAAALEAIANTRRTRLPEPLAARRDFLEADAHFQFGNHERALEIISDQDSFDALMLKGRIYAAIGALTKAGGAYADAAIAGDGDPTPAHTQAAIMAAAVFAQAGDAEALHSLSEKLSARMSPGPAKDLFDGLVAENADGPIDDFTARYAAYFDD